MTINCINACTCKNCISRNARLQFHISIDPNTHPSEYAIALVLKKQRGFNRMFREFLKEYALAVAQQVDEQSISD